MSIEFTCSNCSATLRVSEEHLGKHAKCPSCHTLNVVQPNSPQQIGDPIQVMPTASSISNDQAVPPAKSTLPIARNVAPIRRLASTHLVAHRGGMILSLGIMAIVCNIALVPGILAWVLGRADLNQMRAGIMDREGEGLTQAGMIMGIIMTAMAGISMILVILYFIIVIAFVGLSAAAAGP